MKTIIAILAVSLLAFAADPPLPPAPQPIGRQHPYMSTVTMQWTQVVTTVYQLKFLRTIEVTDGGTDKAAYETNHVLLRTNIVSVTTNDMAGRPP